MTLGENASQAQGRWTPLDVGLHVHVRCHELLNI